MRNMSPARGRVQARRASRCTLRVVERARRRRDGQRAFHPCGPPPSAECTLHGIESARWRSPCPSARTRAAGRSPKVTIARRTARCCARSASTTRTSASRSSASRTATATSRRATSGSAELAAAAAEAIRTAGGMPQTYGTITISRRHLDGHRGHEVLAGVARGDRRLDRDRLARADARRRARGRRLRQEHAGRADRARAPRHPGDLRLRRHDQARAATPATT